MKKDTDAIEHPGNEHSGNHAAGHGDEHPGNHVAGHPVKRAGKVYLTGAGPGDIGLLTLKGLRCLKKADVVVYDYHINSQILNYINRDAELIYAGKRGGHHAMSQEEINAALVEKASQGKIVCRLKGGDPFVFGRGGEEAETLHANGIAFEIIPGVSSAIAAPAYAGIPLTHRKYSSSFAVVTGNEDVAKCKSCIDWPALARGFDTLVFLMGVKNIRFITSALIEHGKSPDTPAALIRWGTRPDQRTLTGTLGGIADMAAAQHLRPPAVMVVGETVRLRDTLRWYEDKPLFGHRVLITRKYSQDYEILEDLGAELYVYPTIDAAPALDYTAADAAIKNAHACHWLIFTSANGIKYFIKRLTETGGDIRDLKGPRICAIGSRTAEAVREYGIRVDVVPEEFNAEGLIKLFEEMGGVSGRKFLLPRADAAREVFPERIRELGGQIDTPPVYRSINPQVTHKGLKRFLRERKITVATFTSAATFNNLIESVGNETVALLKDAAIAVIGPVTKRAVEKAGLKVEIMPEKATVAAMAEAIIEWVGGLRGV
jgi:uroporphyrinogen III methyltransferase/synthase